jgi:hypothetical protein
MAKRKTTVYLEEDLLRRARVHAARTGKRDSDVVEEALREYLGIEALEQVWSRSDLDEDQALELAYEALHRTRDARPPAGLEAGDLDLLAAIAFGRDLAGIAADRGVPETEIRDRLKDVIDRLGEPTRIGEVEGTRSRRKTG